MTYANSVDPDQSDQGLHCAVPLSILRNNCVRHNLGKKVWNKVLKFKDIYLTALPICFYREKKIYLDPFLM